MLDRLRSNVARLIAPRPTTATRRFDAAAESRWTSRTSMGPLNSEVLASATTIRNRASYFCRNNPWMANGVEALISNLVGTGIRPASKHPDAAVRKALQGAFDRWSRQADATGGLDFYGLQTIAVRQLVEAGEVFAQLLPDDTAAIPLSLRLIGADQIDASLTVDKGAAGSIMGGIEFDGQGRRAAYHVSAAAPTSAFATTLPPVRLPAADVLHVFQSLAPGQVRGVSWAAPILLRLADLDELEDALLVRQKVSALFAAFLTDLDADSDPANLGLGSSAGETPTLEPGAVQRLPPGVDLKLATPGEATEGVGFVKSQLRAIAAGLGVPDFMLTGDLSEANYSSLRSGLVQFRRRIEALQFGLLVPLFLRPVWERFVTVAVLSGAIDAPDFETNMADYLAVEFYPPAMEWVDPLKDAEAEAAMIAAGLKSRRQSVAEQGYDVEALDSEIAADRAREAALGLSFTAPVSANAGATA